VFTRGVFLLGIRCICVCSMCCMQIYVQTFNANELLVWLKLEHEFVVGLFGAVLVDEHVYIFQELIIG
jgi:hypothetical protein